MEAGLGDVLVGRVVVLEGVTTVRVTVLDGWVLFVGMVVLVLGPSVLGEVTVVVVGLVVELLPTGEMVLGCTLLDGVTGVGLSLLSVVRTPVTVGMLLPLPLPLKELPLPVVPFARFS